MPRFAANLSMLFDEQPFLERFAAAAAAGFRSVEVQFPYDHPVEALQRRLAEHRLELVLHNLPAGNWAAGDRGLACLPGREAEFRAGVATAIRYATALGCRQVNCLAGRTPAGVEPSRVRRTLVDNLKFSSEALGAAGITPLVEMLNTHDVPGFHLHGTAQALALLAEVGASNLKLQFDVYHLHRMEGDVARTLEANLGRIAHLQVADHPGRHEPGTGEIDYRGLFRLLDRLGYAGWVGCEYQPRAGTTAGLGWIDRLAGPAAA